MVCQGEATGSRRRLLVQRKMRAEAEAEADSLRLSPEMVLEAVSPLHESISSVVPLLDQVFRIFDRLSGASCYR